MDFSRAYLVWRGGNKLVFDEMLNINYLEKTLDENEHEFYFVQPQFDEIKLLYCGFQKCKPHHSYGPAMRDHFFYHFIVSGRGIVKNDQTTFVLTAGSGFLVYPNQVIYYEADALAPWEYMWVAFSGTKAADLISKTIFTPEVPIIKHTSPEKIQKLMNAIISCAHERSFKSLVCATGIFYMLISELFSDGSTQPKQTSNKEIAKIHDYLREALHFMKTNYTKDISVSMIAEHIGLDKSYFIRLFKEQYGTTPATFLQKYRLNIAYYLLQHTTLPIKQIATSVGFSDQLYFTKCFKRYYTKSPTEIRKEASVSDNYVPPRS